MWRIYSNPDPHGVDLMEVFLHVHYVSMRDEDEIHLIQMPLALHPSALFTMI
jgi:hypothetical protein